MEKGFGNGVSKQQNTNYYTEVNNKLELFVNYFVKHFEAKLYAYHLILEGEVKKAGKFSDTFSVIAGQGVGGVAGGLVGLSLGSPTAGANLGAKVGNIGGKILLSKVGNEHHTKEVVKLLDLIDVSQQDKANFRRALIETGLDIFQSFEMQFMRVTTDEGPQKAIRQLAEDATNRAINHLKKKKDISISESAVSGKSKREKIYSIRPGFKIQYKYLLCKSKWNTSSLYDKSGLVIEGKPIPNYYRKKEGKSRTAKYGYRRLLKQENWDKLKEQYDSDNSVESKSDQFTVYQYIVNPKSLEEKSGNLLDNLNSKDKDLGEDRIKKILEDVKQEILKEIKVLKKQSDGYNEDRKILENLELKMKNLNINKYLDKIQQYCEELKQEVHQIKYSIEEVRKENKEGHIKTHEKINVLSQKVDKLVLQETPTQCVISGLGVTEYYYISRTLNRNIKIKDGFKKETSMFFVTTSGKVDKSELQQTQDVVLISNTHSDFVNLCQYHTDRNIHWLKKEKTKFVWQHSYNSLSKLREFVDDEKVPSPEVNKITSIKDRVVIISAGPGMGKFTLLTHLASEQKKFSTSVRVIKINLNDHTDTLHATDFESTNEIFEFLKETTQIRDAKDLDNSILLFDGFDEIASDRDYKSKTIKLIKFLKNEVRHLWITTRPCAQYDLENELSVFSYTIEPLSKKIQWEFLEKFWKTNFVYDIIKRLTVKIRRESEDKEIKNLVGKVSKIIELKIVETKDDDDNLKQIQQLTSTFNILKKDEMVKNITSLIDKELGKRHKISEKIINIVEIVDNVEEIKNLLQTRAKIYAEELIAKFSKSISNTEIKFTGVPLQLRMLAEAFQEHFYEDFIKLYNLKPAQLCVDKPNLPERLNLFDLYDRFVENKRKINFVEKGNIDLTKEVTIEIYEESRERFIKKHQLLALSLLFSEKDLNDFISVEEKDKIKELKQNVGDGKENTGIVYQIIGGKPQFIHRTFAEYFTANFFVDRLKSDKVRIFLNKYILKEENAVIRHFFDRMLTKDEKDQNRCQIHLAVLNNDEEKIKEILLDSENAKCIINSVDKGGRTALHLAVADGYLGIVNILLDHNASVCKKDDIFVLKPLSYADKGNYWRIVELLLQEGASADDILEAKEYIANYGDYHMKFKSLLNKAVRDGYIGLTKVLVEKFGANIKDTNFSGKIPLHIAAQCGHLDIVKFLLNLDQETAKYEDNRHQTPLDVAADYGQLDVVRYLGKYSNLSTEQFNEKLFSIAVNFGYYDIVNSFLIEGKDVNCEMRGWTPLHQAAMKGKLNIVQLLVENGAKFVHVDNTHFNHFLSVGSTPLHQAAFHGYYKIVKYLVEKFVKDDPNINSANKNVYTPLHSAARGGHLSVVKYYVEELKVDINITDNKGTTPLHEAAFGGNDKVVEYLVRKGASINAIDKCGATVVFSAACHNNHKIINFLLDNRANIDCNQGIIGKLGLTVLHVASLYDSIEIVKRLVETEKTNVNSGENSFTPLHLPALSDSSDTINYLINKGAKETFNFDNCAKVFNDEKKVLKEIGLDSVAKFINYFNLQLDVPSYFYKILKDQYNEFNVLLKENQECMINFINEMVIYGIQEIRANFDKLEANKLETCINEKKNDTDFYKNPLIILEALCELGVGDFHKVSLIWMDLESNTETRLFF